MVVVVAVTGAVGALLGAVVVVGDAVVVDVVVLVVASSFTCTGLVDSSDEHAAIPLSRNTVRPTAIASLVDIGHLLMDRRRVFDA